MSRSGEIHVSVVSGLVPDVEELVEGVGCTANMWAVCVGEVVESIFCVGVCAMDDATWLTALARARVSPSADSYPVSVGAELGDVSTSGAHAVERRPGRTVGRFDDRVVVFQQCTTSGIGRHRETPGPAGVTRGPVEATCCRATVSGHDRTPAAARVRSGAKGN